MTYSIVKSLFLDNAVKTAADIQNAADDIVLECQDLFGRIQKAHAASPTGKAGTDEKRDAILADDTFSWLYPDMGKPDKKGVSKPVTSDITGLIKRGMLFIGDDAILEHSDLTAGELFVAACTAGTIAKKGSVDFNNIKKAIKPKAPKIENEIVTNDDDDTSVSLDQMDADHAAGLDEAPKPQSIADMAAALIEKLGKIEANKLSIALADLCEPSLSDDEIENSMHG